MTKKSKPWRVEVRQPGKDAETQDFGSERRAYDFLPPFMASQSGARITVRHWENDTWVLFETMTDQD